MKDNTMTPHLTPEQLKMLLDVYVATEGDTERAFDLREAYAADAEGRPTLRAVQALTDRNLRFLFPQSHSSVRLTESGKEYIEHLVY